MKNILLMSILTISIFANPICRDSLSNTITENIDALCTWQINVTTIAPYSSACAISATTTNIICDDNGTPVDPSDDTYTFDVTVTGSDTGSGWTANDPYNTTGTYNTAVSFGPYAISGGNLSFTITDNVHAGCTTTVNVTAPATCSNTCVISATTANVACDDNGTPADPSDDTFSFDVTVTGFNTGASWTANDPNSTTGTYNAAVSFGPYPISGGNLSFTIIDIDEPGCTTQITMTAPATCSFPCTISSTQTTPVCDDNGTSSDPSDDTYTFLVTVTGSNTGATWTANDTNNTSGTYNTAVSFGPYPISGGNLNFTIRDIDDVGCTTVVGISAPATCSNPCVIMASIANIACDDNGTPPDPNDDTYTFDVIVTGSNTGASWTANDPNNTAGAYNTAVSFGPYPISGGNLAFDITDIIDGNCTESLSVTAPNTCAVASPLHIVEGGNFGVFREGETNSDDRAFILSSNTAGQYVQLEVRGNAETGTLFGLPLANMGYVRASNVSLFVVGNNTGDLVFAPGNSEKVRINSLGNLGIGVINPQRKLHISDAFRLEPLSAPPSSPSAGDLYFGTDGFLHLFNGSNWHTLDMTVEP